MLALAGIMLWLSASLVASSTTGYLRCTKPTRKHMKSDVAAYIKYYNPKRLHSANSDETPVRFEQLFCRGAKTMKGSLAILAFGIGNQN